MNRRVASLLAWVLTGIIAAATFAGIGSYLLTQASQGSLVKQVADVLWRLVPLEFAILAALIVAHQPRHLVGWLMMVPGLTTAPIVLLVPFGLQLTVAPPGSPSLAFLLALWLDNCGWTLLVFPLVLILLLFPTGRPPSPRWSWVVGCAIGLWAGIVLTATFEQRLQPTSVVVDWSVVNPIGFIPAEYLNNGMFSGFLTVGLALLAVSCAVALFLRFRRGAAGEREQIKWLLYACGLFAAVILAGTPLNLDTTSASSDIFSLLYVLSIVTIPVAIAVAVLRYRLWDIDVIIKRTLVYIPLTAIVAGVFAAATSLSQKAFVAVAGQDSLGSTVLATLIVVASFNPIKERVQKLVDKGFKEAPSPSKRLNTFGERVRTRVSDVEVGPIMWRFVDEAVAAFDAEGGAAYVDEGGRLRQIHTAGEWKGDERMSVPVEASGIRIACVALSRRRRGGDYADLDRKAMEQAAEAVGKAVEEDRASQRALHPQETF
jgi:hypothetical protein